MIYELFCEVFLIFLKFLGFSTVKGEKMSTVNSNNLNSSALENFRSRNDDFTVEIISNGFVMSATGRDHDDEWISEKMHFSKLADLVVAIDVFSKLKKS
jgi:hypothetical protein